MPEGPLRLDSSDSRVRGDSSSSAPASAPASKNPEPLDSQSKTDDRTQVVAQYSLFNSLKALFSSTKLTTVPKEKVDVLADKPEAQQVKAKTEQASKRKANITKGWQFPRWNWSLKSSALWRWLFKPAEASIVTEVARKEQLLQSGTSWLCSNFFVERHFLQESVPIFVERYCRESSPSTDTSKVMRSMLTDLMRERSPEPSNNNQFGAFLVIKDPSPAETYSRIFFGFYTSQDKADLAGKIGSDILTAQGKSVTYPETIHIPPEKRGDHIELTFKLVRPGSIKLMPNDTVPLSHFKTNMIDIFAEMDKLQSLASTNPRQTKVNPTRSQMSVESPVLLNKTDLINDTFFVRNLVASFSHTYSTETPFALIAKIKGKRTCLGYFGQQDYAESMGEYMKLIKGIQIIAVSANQQSCPHQNPFELIYKKYKEKLVLSSICYTIEREIDVPTAPALISDYRKTKDVDHQCPAYIQKRIPDGSLKDEFLGYFRSKEQAENMAQVAQKLLNQDNDHYVNLRKGGSLTESPDAILQGDLFDRLARAYVHRELPQ